MHDPVAYVLDQVSEQVEGGLVPPVSTIQAVRRFCGAMAKNHAKHHLVTLDDGRVVSVAHGTRLLETVDDPETA